jgi:DNA-binding MarR family transcriptional regulator
VTAAVDVGVSRIDLGGDDGEMGEPAVDRRLSPRRWRILSLLALHGGATVRDVALVLGVARLTAQRDLAWLYQAGLVDRWRSNEDRTHTWIYDITPDGTGLLRETLIAAGRRVPLQLGHRTWGAADHLLFLPLLEVSRRQPDRCAVFQWLTTLDTSVWLRGHDLAHLRADGFGVWLEGGHALRFLVHVDPGLPGGAVTECERHTSVLDALLAGYRRTDPAVPVGAVLIIANTPEREEHLLADLVERPVHAPIATTTKDLLYRYWPNEPLWRVPGADGNRRRLIDLTP